MKQIFADTFYWVALINKKDNWHQRVIEVTSTLKNVEIVTTDAVLIEVLNFLSAIVPLRRRTVQFVDELMSKKINRDHVKRRRKPRMKLIIAPFPEREKNPENFFFTNPLTSCFSA